MLKRIIKLIISIIFFIFLKFKFFRKIFKTNNYNILYYHGISGDEKYLFSKQLSLMTKWAYVKPIGNKEYTKQDKPYISITFDDALLSVLQNAQPELIKNNIPFTVFIPSGHLGKIPNWEINSNENKISEPVMNLCQLKLLDKNLCTFGSHTVNHKDLVKISISEAKNEMEESKKTLENLLQRPIEYFSFPYGSYNYELVELAKEIGFKYIYTVITSSVSLNKNEYLFGRVSVSPYDWPLELYLKINGGYNWLGILQKRKILGIKSYIKKV